MFAFQNKKYDVEYDVEYEGLCVTADECLEATLLQGYESFQAGDL